MNLQTSGAACRENAKLCLRTCRCLKNESEETTYVVPASAPGPQRERNCAHRGGADSRFGSVTDAFCTNERQGLWVPAFAGTTIEYASAFSRHDAPEFCKFIRPKK